MNKPASTPLDWPDYCCRMGEGILLVALALTLLYALGMTFNVGVVLWVVGAGYLYAKPKQRGIEYARTSQHSGYRFKVWQDCFRRSNWQSVDWPFFERRTNEGEFGPNGARETIDAYLSTNFLPPRVEPPSETEVKKERVYNAFCKWVGESSMEWSPRIQELRADLNYWRNGDDRLYKEATAYYEHRRRMREEGLQPD